MMRRTERRLVAAYVVVTLLLAVANAVAVTAGWYCTVCGAR